MKVLFLDIDGVVNCSTTVQRHNGFFGIDPYMALLVGRIAEATNCKIVLSSSWRHHKESVEMIGKRVWPIFDVTPTLGGPRGGEIKDWLDEYQAKFGGSTETEVTRYAILDDDSDMLPEQLPNFFQTSWKDGLSEETANKVIAHLL